MTNKKCNTAVVAVAPAAGRKQPSTLISPTLSNADPTFLGASTRETSNTDIALVQEEQQKYNPIRATTVRDHQDTKQH